MSAPIPAIVRVGLFLTFFLLTVAYALIRGGRPERQAALILGGSLLLTWLLIHPFVRRYHGPEYGVATADGLMLIGVIWLALTADRFWTLWLAAIQMVVVLNHIAMIVKPFTLPTYYKNTVQLWSYPIVGLLAIGTLRYRLRTNPLRLEAWIGRAARRCRAQFSHERTVALRRRAAAPHESGVPGDGNGTKPPAP